MSMQQRAALQCENAALEAMRDHIPYTVLGFMAGEMIAYLEGCGWVAV